MDIKSFALILISRFYGLISILLRPFVKVNNNSILFWSWNSRQYSCNPKAISDYILSQHESDFKIYWSFKRSFPRTIDERIIPLRWGTLKYLITALSCKFLVSNTRNNIDTMLFYKRKNQVYIMTWHAGMGLKKAERDSINSLHKRYVKRCKTDSKMCDLMISGSMFQTNLFENSFWYEGDILNCGTPRNDIFFLDGNTIRKNFCKSIHIQESSIIVLYAPTFRTVFNPEIIYFNWGRIKNAIETKFHKKAVLIVRLHPNIQKMASKLEFRFNNYDCINVTSYPDMQELLKVSDILITDYSSSMFDFSLTKKPCFLFVKDRSEFDRDLYISLSELPFTLSESEHDLENNILNFNEDVYINQLNRFNKTRIESFEKGKACDTIYHWLSFKKKE